MDEKQYGSDQPGYDTDTFGAVGQQQQQQDQQQQPRKEGTYQQDTPWRDVPPHGTYTQGTYTQGAGGSYQQNNTWQGAPYQQNSQPGNGFGVASMILGILSLVLFCTCLNIPLAILSVVFAIVHLNRRAGSGGFAVAGIITSVVSVILTIITIVLLYVVGISTSTWDYSTTLPFEQFIDGGGQQDPGGAEEWQDYTDDPSDFMNYLNDGKAQTF